MGTDRRRNKVLRTLLNALHEVDRACKTLGITYWIDGDTLVGAFRDGAPIPSDDDVDLCMLPRDVARFVELAPDLLGPDFSVQTPADDPAITSTVKVYVNGTHAPSLFHELHDLPRPIHDGLFVSIMVVSAVSEFAVVRRMERTMALVVKTESYAAAMARSPEVRRGRQRLKWMLIARVPRTAIRWMARWLASRQSRRDGNLLGIPSSGTPGVVRRRVIFPVSPLRLGGLTVPAPADPETYLRAQAALVDLMPRAEVDEPVDNTGLLTADEP